MRHSSQQTPLILIADANEDNLYLLETVVQDLGFRSLALSCGAAAIQTCKRCKPDLALIETHFPGVSGAEIVAAMRRSHPKDSIPAIAVTSAAMEGDRAHCLNMGFDDYLAKPYSIAALEQLIYKHIRSQAEHTGFSQTLSKYFNKIA